MQPEKDAKEQRKGRLIEKHKPLVLHLAKKISNSLPFQTDFEDLVAYSKEKPQFYAGSMVSDEG